MQRSFACQVKSSPDIRGDRRDGRALLSAYYVRKISLTRIRILRGDAWCSRLLASEFHSLPTPDSRVYPTFQRPLVLLSDQIQPPPSIAGQCHRLQLHICSLQQGTAAARRPIPTMVQQGEMKRGKQSMAMLVRVQSNRLIVYQPAL